MEKDTAMQELKQVEEMMVRLLKPLKEIPEFQYSQLLMQKFKFFLNDYAKKTNSIQAEYFKQPYHLKLLFKSDPNIQAEQSSQTKQTEKKTKLPPPNIFAYSYQLPCFYQIYEKIIRSEQIQKKVDEIISKYQILKEIITSDSITVQLVYLSYKRVMIIAPRQFIYVRIFFKDSVNNGSSSKHWILTCSVPYQSQPGKTRGQIVFTVQKIEGNMEQKCIRVKVYSQIDMKMAVKPEMAKTKGFSQVKKYIQNIYEFSKTC